MCACVCGGLPIPSGSANHAAGPSGRPRRPALALTTLGSEEPGLLGEKAELSDLSILYQKVRTHQKDAGTD